MARRRKLIPPIAPHAPVAEPTASGPTNIIEATGATTLGHDLLWGAEAIAHYLGIDVRRCFYLLGNGALPATKTGATWTSTKSRLRRHFAGEAAS
jgi:hypothetical protein